MNKFVDRFVSPFSVGAVAGAEGWERMYPYYLLFSEDNRTWEDEAFWFQESMHHPQPQPPFDSIINECIRVGLGQYNSRVFALPPAYGLEQRVLNGYLYFSVVPVVDEQWQKERAGIFAQRAGFYYDHWGELFDQWKLKMTALIEELKQLAVPTLPRIENDSVVFEAKGVSSASRLLAAYHALIDSIFVAWQYHFEMLNLGYAAYADLFRFCRQSFPGIRDETIAELVAGLDAVLFRPHDELKQLARLALELKLQSEFSVEETPDQKIERLRQTAGGEKWVAALEAAKDPWFYHSCGTGFYHYDRSWIDSLSVPFDTIRFYIRQIENGVDLERPRFDLIARREQLEEHLRASLQEERERTVFDETLRLSRRVAGYIEDHNFYVEHWYHTLFWNKVRVFGLRLVEAGVLEDVEDIFMLNRWEVGQALYDVVGTWATGAPSRSGVYWRREVAERSKILDTLRAYSPPPALGPLPESEEPMSAMLFGITREQLTRWRHQAVEDTVQKIKGIPVSRGTAEGPARIVLEAADLASVTEGDILVCSCLAPSWASVFGKVRAIVSEFGGIMSHAAIVCREYGITAVVGATGATQSIRNGDIVRVDGHAGTVQIMVADLSDAHCFSK